MFKYGEGGQVKIELNSFKNFYDHFRKPKYTENLIIQVIKFISNICLQELKFKSKELYTATTYFRRFFLKNSILEFDPYHIGVVCVYLAAKVEEREVELHKILKVLQR